MKTMKKSIGIIVAALAFCMLFGVSAKVEAAAAPKSVKVAYISSDRTDVSIELPSRADYGYQVALYNANKKLIATDLCSFYASFENKIRPNKVYYYRARVYDRWNTKAVSGWSKLQAFSTAKYRLAQAGKTRAMYFKAPKITGVKYYKVYMSAYRDKGFKLLKKVKPGKKDKLTKTPKTKGFSYNKYYYLKVKPVLTKGGYAQDFSVPYFYFYKIYY